MTTRRSAKRITSVDVARAAGVSRATVSYVINNTSSETISEETRTRVLKAASLLGYTPYGPARTLASGRSDVVLMVMPNWPVSQRISRILDDLECALAEEHLALVTHRLSRSGEVVADVWKAIGPCGVIGMHAFSREDAAVMRHTGIAVACATFEDEPGATEPGVIVMSQAAFGDAQVRHLAAAGHQRLAFAYPANPRLEMYARRRLDGVRLACSELGLADPEVQIFDATLPAASGAIDGWRTSDAGPTAICAYNDEWAMAVMAAARERGILVPRDLAVIGVDNDVAGQISTPTLTTVDRDWGEFARYLASCIVEALRGEEMPAHHDALPVHLIVRESAP